MTRREKAKHKTIAFLKEIGLTLEERSGAKGFLKGITFEDGVLVYDEKTTSAPDLLHEAGHLAVLPARYRSSAGADLDVLYEQMGETIPTLQIDGPEMRAIMQSGEAEATAWSYAAGVAIGLDIRDIIDAKDFDGGGEGVRAALSYGAHLGVQGLIHGGMCVNRRTYPVLTRWLQD